MSITSIMTLIGSFVMIGGWLLIGKRARKSPLGVSLQVRYLEIFFLNMGLFCISIFLPQLALSLQPSLFPAVMAWGYIIGHIFAYIAFTSVLMLTFSMIPKLADKQYLALGIGIVCGTIITVLTIITMGFGTQPQYDYENNITLLNTAQAVGALIGLFATICVLPAAVLMIRNGVRNPAARVRSFLLGGGLFVIMTAGPLHDVAKTWQVYMAADVISIVGFAILSCGVLYRFEERIAPAAQRSMRKPLATH